MAKKPESTIVRPVCETCRHWVRLDRERGECRRYAPTPEMLGALGMLNGYRAHETVWPSTADADRCGDWKETSHDRP